MGIRAAFVFCCIAIFATQIFAGIPSSARRQRPGLTTAGRFEPNVGQFRYTDGRLADHIDAVATVEGGVAFIHAGGIHIVRDRRQPPDSADRPDDVVLDMLRADVVFIGANPRPRLQFDGTDGLVRCLGASTNGAAPYARSMSYIDVWPGIDLRMTVTNVGLKYDFIVRPGADASRIAMRYDGIDSLVRTDDGALRAATAFGPLWDMAPVSWTEDYLGRQRSAVDVRFRIDGHAVRFEANAYDTRHTLVIDPQRRWATYYGPNPSTTASTADTASYHTAIDIYGKVILGGTAILPTLPPQSGRVIRRHKAKSDGWVSRWNDQGRLLWHTYYGGSQADVFNDLTTDENGNIWACGWSESLDLPGMQAGSSPTSPYGVRDAPLFAGKREIMVVKFDTAGRNGDQWLLCGKEDDEARAISVWKDRVAVAGITWSYTLAEQDGTPFKNASRHGTGPLPEAEAFVAQVRRTQAGFYDPEFLSFFGGTVSDVATAVAHDTKGNVVVAGVTASNNLPVTDGSVYRKGQDGFVFSVTSAKTPAVNFATVFGSTENDVVHDIATDALDNIVVVGHTEGTNFPTVNALRTTPEGADDAFIRSYRANGTVGFSTYYGGTVQETFFGVATAPDRSIWVGGQTDRSDGHPITTDAFMDRPYVTRLSDSITIGLDGYFARIASDGRSVLYATYYGAPPQDNLPTPPPPGEQADPAPPSTDTGLDAIVGLAVDENATIVTAQSVKGLRMPTTPGAWQDSSSLVKDTMRVNGFLSLWTNCRDSVVAVSTLDGSAPVICDGQGTLTLVAPLGFASYRWNDGPPSTNRLVVTTPGTFVCTMRTAEGCRYYDTVVITTSPRPTVDAGPDVDICADSTTILIATPGGGTPPYTYRWDRLEAGPEFIDDATSDRPGVTPTSSSRYEVLVTDAAGCSARDTVALVLRAPRPALAPDTVSVRSLGACESSADTTITVTNPMPWPVTITDVTAASPDITLVTPIGAGLVIAPGASTTLTIRLAPTGAGPFRSSLTIRGLPCSWTATRPVHGNKERLLATATPASITFPAGVPCDTSRLVDSVLVRNNGSAAMTLGMATLPSPFRIVAPDADIVIPPGGSQQVVIACDVAAASAGTTTARLSLPYTAEACVDSLGVQVSFRLSTVSATLDVDSLDFGTLDGCQESAIRAVTVTNTGDDVIRIVLPADDDVVTFLPSGGRRGDTIVLAVGASRTIDVEVRPSTIGPFDLRRTFRTVPCDGILDLRCTGTRNGLSFSVPALVDLGEVEACATDLPRRGSFDITFTGTGSATIDSVVAPATVGVSATVDVGMVLLPNVPHRVDVTWTPTSTGSLVDSVVIVFQPCGIRRVVTLTGTATSVALEAVTGTAILGTIPTTASGTSQFRNTGSDTVDVAIRPSIHVTIGTFDPAALRGILPGGVIDIPWTLTCSGRVDVSDTIEVVTTAPCPAVATTYLTGTCTTETAATADVAIDSVEMRVGERRTVAVRLRTSSGLVARGAHRWATTIEYNPLVVVGSGATPDCWAPGLSGPCSIVLQGDLGTDTAGVMAALDLTAVLGNAPTTDLRLVDVSWPDAPSTVTTRTNGHVRITDLCDDGGLRLLTPSAANQLVLRPLPAKDYLDIALGGLGRGGAQIMILDVIGRTVASGHLESTTTTRVDLEDLPDGTYVLVATSSARTHSTTFVIRR